MEIEANVTADNSRRKSLREWISQPRVKWLIAIVVIIFLLTIVLVVTISFVGNDEKLMKLWPSPNKPKNVIHFIHGQPSDYELSWSHLTNQLDELFSRYKTIAEVGEDAVVCKGPLTEDNKVCYFDIGEMYQECTRETNYGYDLGKPCVFLEFNNITNWVPDPYTGREMNELGAIDYTFGDHPVGEEMVYLDCQGVTQFDKENIGAIIYTPYRGFQVKFFPYRGNPNFMSPIVGIKFMKPTTGVAISVICKLYAKNIYHSNDGDSKGEIIFNFLID